MSTWQQFLSTPVTVTDVLWILAGALITGLVLRAIFRD